MRKPLRQPDSAAQTDDHVGNDEEERGLGEAPNEAERERRLP
jgi:hypothetical protein